MLRYPSVSAFSCFALLVILLTSCKTPKNTTYFQTIPYNSEVQTLITKDFEHKVKVDDILQINIFSPSTDIALYNTAPEGYVVDKNGNIQLYKIGDVKVIGLTLMQVKEKLTKILMPDYLLQVAVSTRFRNHKIVILGEVGSPGIIIMETEHLSILEAISVKGDLAENARKDNILVIRNTERGKMFYRINLLDASVFNSPYYYLQPDDIVYVEAEPTKKDANTGQIFGYVLSGLSFLFLVFDRINR